MINPLQDPNADGRVRVNLDVDENGAASRDIFDATPDGIAAAEVEQSIVWHVTETAGLEIGDRPATETRIETVDNQGAVTVNQPTGAFPGADANVSLTGGKPGSRVTVVLTLKEPA